MFYGERGSIEASGAMLKEAGFTVSEQCSSRPSCFDFAARKSSTLVLIKVQSDIGNLSSNDALELRAISKSVGAVSLLISSQAREKPLEDDTVYTRYALLSVTEKTFENIVLHRTLPLMQANPGGCYVEINGEAIKRRRQQLGLSVGDTAKMVGISRRTLYGYERGMAKASVTVAYNLIYTLGIPVARPVDIFGKAGNQSRCCFLTKAKRMIAGNSLLNRIFHKFALYPFTAVKKAPFDFVMDVPEEKMRIVGGIAREKEAALDRRVDEILSVSKVIRAHPILITEGQEPSNRDIPCIHGDALSMIRDPDDLIESII